MLFVLRLPHINFIFNVADLIFNLVLSKELLTQLWHIQVINWVFQFLNQGFNYSLSWHFKFVQFLQFFNLVTKILYRFDLVRNLEYLCLYVVMLLFQFLPCHIITIKNNFLSSAENSFAALINCLLHSSGIATEP